MAPELRGWAAARPLAPRTDPAVLAAAGCPFIEIHEPALAGIGDDPDAWARVRDLHAAMTDGVDRHPPVPGGHRRRDRPGGLRRRCSRRRSRATPLDLIAGPENWRFVRVVPGERGIVCGALAPDPGGDEGPETLLWAAAYAASSQGRGRDRVGLSTASSLAGLPWDVAVRKLERLGAAVGARQRIASTSCGRAWIRARSTPGRPRSGTVRRLAAAARETSLEPRRADLIPLRDGATIPRTSPDRRILIARHPPQEVLSVGEHISLTVNGTPRELDVEPRRLLVQALREDLDLTGTHVGCDTSQCGACTVHVDGKAMKSCTMLAVQADGAVGDDDRGHGHRRRASTRSRTRSGRSTACSAASARRA